MVTTFDTAGPSGAWFPSKLLSYSFVVPEVSTAPPARPVVPRSTMGNKCECFCFGGVVWSLSTHQSSILPDVSLAKESRVDAEESNKVDTGG